MKRWQLTWMLGGAAALAALMAPVLTGVNVLPSGLWAPNGTLQLEAGLDREVVLDGERRSRQLVVEIGASTRMQRDLAPRDVVVVLDASGSMWSGSKMFHAKQAVQGLVDRLEPTEDFALVVFNDEARTAVPPGATKGELAGLLDSIHEYGGSNLYAGLELGAAHLRAMRSDGEEGHLMVISDGEANVGIVEPVAFDRLVGSLAGEDIVISAIGIGPDAHRSELARIASMGRGVSDVLPDASRLRERLAAAHRGSGDLVARDLDLSIREGTGVELVRWLGTVPWSRLTEGERLVAVADLRLDPRARSFVVELSFTDPEGTRRFQSRRVEIRSSRSPAVVAASVDRRRMALATRFSVADRLEHPSGPGLLSDVVFQLATELRDVARRHQIPELQAAATELLDAVEAAEHSGTTGMATTAEELARDLVR